MKRIEQHLKQGQLTMKRKLESMHIGRQYQIKKHPKSGWIVTRPDTLSTVKISQGIVDRTKATLESGQSIAFRKISYTVAIETAVVQILSDIIDVDAINKVYTLA